MDRFDQLLARIKDKTQNVRGWLSKREIGLLATLASCPTRPGEILEIGTFRGLSAIVLATAAAESDQTRIIAVDPLCHPGMDLRDQTADDAEQELRRNLELAEVSQFVELKRMTSEEFLPQMNRPLRLLWIDGDHGYSGAAFDIREYSRFLVDGGVIACHDILSPFGCTQAFKELIVENPHYGPIGFCGSIGWAQYHADPAKSAGYEREKKLLSRRLDPLCRLTDKAGKSKMHRAFYRLHRFRIRHGSIGPAQWSRHLASVESGMATI